MIKLLSFLPFSISMGGLQTARIASGSKWRGTIRQSTHVMILSVTHTIFESHFCTALTNSNVTNINIMVTLIRVQAKLVLVTFKNSEVNSVNWETSSKCPEHEKYCIRTPLLMYIDLLATWDYL